MKLKILLLAFSVIMASCASGQGFFKPLPKPIASAKVGAAATPLIQNNIRPVIGVTAIFSDQTTLAGGVGISLMHNKFDDPSQSWVTQYSISALAFLDTKAAVTAGLSFGFLNLFSIGYGYNFMTKQGGLLTGVTIKPF